MAAAGLAAPAAAGQENLESRTGSTPEYVRLEAVGARLVHASQGLCAAPQPAPDDLPFASRYRSRCGGFIVAHDRNLNAWADGGRVVVTTRMMRFADQDDALAFVVAHEMAHNILGHAERLKGISPKFPSPRDADRIKQSEVEADLLAVNLMSRAGFDLRAAEQFLNKLKNQRPAFAGATHLSLSMRIGMIKEAISELR